VPGLRQEAESLSQLELLPVRTAVASRLAIRSRARDRWRDGFQAERQQRLRPGTELVAFIVHGVEDRPIGFCKAAGMPEGKQGKGQAVEFPGLVGGQRRVGQGKAAQIFVRERKGLIRDAEAGQAGAAQAEST
jgi:hypothetical protein